MDNLETASNASDNQSDCLSSNLSSLSGLTGYEEELYDLKHLIKGPSGSSGIVAKSNPSGNHNQFEVFEDRIRKLNTELQNALKLNEKYKNDMYNLERKTELAFHEKFEKLMRHNAHLETQLVVSNDRIRGLLNRQVVSDTKHTENGRILELEHKAAQLEKQNFEINSRINLLQNEVVHWKNEAESNDILNGRLKLELEEAKIDVDTKNNSIAGLKGKIVDLHMEMQSLTQDNIKINNSVIVLSNEVNSYKKSELWYKEQLHQCRSQKSRASEEVAELRSQLVTKGHDLDVRNVDFDRLKNQYEELQLTALQEKENLLKRIDKLELRACSNNKSPVNISEDRSTLEIYESTIQSLTKELATIKDAVSDQQSSFDQLNKQNSDLVARNTALQKMLNEKEISISSLESEKKDLNMKLEILNARLWENERHLLKLVNEKSQIEVALNGANREKCEIEEAVSRIRDNFAKFVGKYNKIKEELYEKNRLVLGLQNERATLNGRSEQLELSIGKIKEVAEANKKLQIQVRNLNTSFETTAKDLENCERIKKQLECEVSSCHTVAANLKHQLEMGTKNITIAKDSEIKQIREKFESEISSAKQIKENLESEVMLHQKAVVSLRDELATKVNMVKIRQVEINQINEKYESELVLCNQNKERLENEVMSYQQTVANLKENLATLANDLQLRDKHVNELNLNISNLKSDVAMYVQRLSVAQEASDRYKNEFSGIDRANKLLQDENSELKDKLAKFAMNNFNGYSRTNKDSQSELELWFSCILEGISSSLSGDLKRIHEVSKCPVQIYSKKIENGLAEVDRLLHVQSNDFQKMCQVNKQLKCKVRNKILQTEDRCNLLRKRNEVDNEALHELKTIINENINKYKRIEIIRRAANEAKLLEEMKNLKSLCKAKELENKEKQKRNEVNNRTLLRKVKEHMRGRNSAEKRCTYLQELYNAVFDELNSYKLRESSKDSEIQNLQSTCENYKNIGVKMKQEVLRLEKEYIVMEGKCVEYESLKKNCATLEARFKVCEEQIQLYIGQLKEKDALINNFQTEIQEALRNNAALQKENRDLRTELKGVSDKLNDGKKEVGKLEEVLQKEKKALQELRDKLIDGQRQHSACIMQLESAQQTSQHTREKNKLLCEEVQALSCKLDQRSKDLSSLQAEKNLLESSWHQKETHMQTFTNNLQSEIQVLQNELSLVRSDKYFLQRLCSDLKFALQTCTNQSKILKKHIQTLSSESRECSSLPDSGMNLPSPSKYDDAYINQLLKQSSAPPIDKPLGDLQNCLNSLKKEMICLRKQVTEKAGYRV